MSDAQSPVAEIKQFVESTNEYFSVRFNREVLRRDQRFMVHLAKTSDYLLMIDLVLNIIAREEHRIGVDLISRDIGLYCDLLLGDGEDTKFFSWVAKNATSVVRVTFLTYGIDDGYANCLDIAAGLEPELRKPFHNRLAISRQLKARALD
jgi:hypothetical protein